MGITLSRIEHPLDSVWDCDILQKLVYEGRHKPYTNVYEPEEAIWHKKNEIDY